MGRILSIFFCDPSSSPIISTFAAYAETETPKKLKAKRDRHSGVDELQPY